MNAIIDQLHTLGYAEKLELREALEEAIAEELAGPRADPGECPWCGSPSFVRRGKDPDGSQRWLCRGCARTFSAKSAGLLSRSKLGAGTWMAFAGCMADALPLRETASRCGVSVPTAWFMRMRVCEVVSYRLGNARAGTFHVDETYVVKSLSGNHGRSRWFSMPREPHRNGQDGRRGNPSKSRERVCVVCGVNEFGDSFSELATDGAPAKIDMRLVLEDRLPKGSFYVTDGHASYPDDMEGLYREAVDPGDPVRTGHIAMVNALHSRLKGFLRPFHGVATRRLQRYLDWFSWREQFRKSDADRRGLLYRHECEGRYRITRGLTFLEERPFQSYWNRRIEAQRTRYIPMVV